MTNVFQTRIHAGLVASLKAWAPLTAIVLPGNIYSPILPGWRPEAIRNANLGSRPAIELSDTQWTFAPEPSSKAVQFETTVGFRLSSGDLRSPLLLFASMLSLQAIVQGWEGGNRWGCSDFLDHYDPIRGRVSLGDEGTTQTATWVTMFTLTTRWRISRQQFMTMQLVKE